MPAVTNIVAGGIDFSGILGRAYVRSKSVRVSGRLDGSSLNLGSSEHFVSFTVPRDMLPAAQRTLRLNSLVPFSAIYSTGEMVANAVVLVKGVEPLDGGEVEFTLAVGPNEAVLKDRAP